MDADAATRDDPFKVNSLVLGDGADPVAGRVRWAPARSLWNAGMLLSALLLGPLLASWDALAVFFGLSAATLCAGHSVGMHRRLIHRSFQCSTMTEHVLVWMGVAVGMGGPLWTIRVHDTRDWAQRQPRCHPLLSHRSGLLRDFWWNLHCRLVLERPPGFDPGPVIAGDRFYRFLDRTWMLQQVAIGLPLYFAGGWAWVVWGVCVRVAACATMHWYIGRLAHTQGPQSWRVDAAGVQAHDVPLAAIPTMGESWHNNHHAFPASARHGLYPGQIDLGWHFIRLLGTLGLAWDIRTPENLPPRPGLTPMRPGVTRAAALRRPA